MAKMTVTASGGGQPGVLALGEAAESALKKAGERLSAELKSSIGRKGLVDTGQLKDSIKPSKVKAEGSARYVEVYPHGTRKKTGKQKKGVRNAEVGFVLEYGTSSTPAAHWMSDAFDDVEEEINGILEQGIGDALEDSLTEIIDEIF